MPGLSPGSLRSSAKVTVYSTTPEELTSPVPSTAMTCAASSSVGSASTVTVAGWPDADLRRVALGEAGDDLHAR